MKKICNLIILLVAIITPATIYSQSASESEQYVAEMKKMLEASDAKEMMIQTIATSWESMHLPVSDCRAAAEAVVDDIWPDLIQDYATEYQKYFSISDMKKINEFYETSTGKKFAKYSTVMSAAIQQTITRKYASRIQQVISKFMK